MRDLDQEAQPLGVRESQPIVGQHSCLWPLFSLLVVLLGLPVGSMWYAHVWRARPQGHLTACKSHCKRVAEALEVYASDNQGQYPPRLEPYLIEGNYLKAIPTCPAVGRMTFSDYQTHRRYNRFQFSCQGNNHAAAYSSFGKPSEGLPTYNSEEGLLDHP